MKITALGRPFYHYPKSNAFISKVSMSAPKSQGADIFCFKGASTLSDKASIIPSSNPTDLEYQVEKNTGIVPVDTVVKKFKNGETYVNIAGNIRGKDVYIMPAGGNNVNDNLMETYLKEVSELYEMTKMAYNVAKENGDLNACAFLMKFTRIISIIIGQVYTLRDKAEQMPTDYDSYDAHIDDWGIDGVDLTNPHTVDD